MPNDDKSTVQVTAYLSLEMVRLLDELARANKRTRSNQIYTILSEALKVERKGDDGND